MSREGEGDVDLCRLGDLERLLCGERERLLLRSRSLDRDLSRRQRSLSRDVDRDRLRCLRGERLRLPASYFLTHFYSLAFPSAWAGMNQKVIYTKGTLSCILKKDVVHLLEKTTRLPAEEIWGHQTTKQQKAVYVAGKGEGKSEYLLDTYVPELYSSLNYAR
ncbi:hypothetical protein JEQ12_014770 [Ovis aries]|uniref:Uncharacterized protein n=1 Tax=Ovis aries TaxID=9940 RepID=A0A836ALG5_SHEEP|nr:hypothetical protein JEQ12_014770 [Ovis aries]